MINEVLSVRTKFLVSDTSYAHLCGKSEHRVLLVEGCSINRLFLFQEDLEPREDAGPALVVHGLLDFADNPLGQVAR